MTRDVRVTLRHAMDVRVTLMDVRVTLRHAMDVRVTLRSCYGCQGNTQSMLWMSG